MAEAKFSCSVLDVGQGSMQLIEQGDEVNIIVDCNICKAPEHVLRYLARRKVTAVELLILSGTDQDHADADGLEMLWNRFGTSIKRVWYPGFSAETDNWKRVKKLLAKMKDAGVEVWSPTAGHETTLGELGIKVLSPHPADSDTSNNASIVLKITAGGVGFLLPGDCESEERWRNILKYFKRHLPSDFLLAAHHGSANGCVEDVVKVIAPAYTVISCGEDNQFDHPDPEALTIYKKYTSKEVYITHEVGSVLLESDGESITDVVLDAGQDPDGKKNVKAAPLLTVAPTPMFEFPNRPTLPNKPRGFA
jgi:beta-lactamase superfamily II metal-dependent hydrolase